MFERNQKDESTSLYSCIDTNQTSIHNMSHSRRQLFPSIEEDGFDDFSYITPLNSKTNLNDSVQSTDHQLLNHSEDENLLVFSRNSIGDYIIIENIHDTTKKNNVENDTAVVKTPQNDKFSDPNTNLIMSPLYLSPPQIVPQSIATSPKKIKPKSPINNEILESTGLNTVANKLIRNYSEESSPSIGIESGNCKMPISRLSLNKQLKLDQNSKVRLELFPKGELSKSYEQTSKTKNKPSIYLCAKKGNKRGFGQINAGVGHKIRRPKVKKVSSQEIIKSALKIIDNSPLNDYLKSIENFQMDFGKTQIQPLVNNKSNSEMSGNKSENLIENNRFTKKRAAESALLDENKKFFKSLRSSRIFMDEHFNFKLNKEKDDSVVGENINLKEFDINLDVSDLMEPEKENLIPSDTIDKILGSLESVGNTGNKLKSGSESEQLVLKAHTSVTMSENSIHLHVPSENSSNNVNVLLTKHLVDKSILLSPTSQMCSMTSGLALNSPTRTQNICSVDDINFMISTADMEQEKLYPIFCGKQNTPSTSFKAPKNPVSKRIKPLPKNQLLLDLGQKKFGATLCTVCKFLYHMGDPNDELLHLNYHNSGSVYRYSGWKDERIVSQLVNARIIKVIPSDPKPWLKKLKDLLEIINRDLGYYEMPVPLDNVQAFLYIQNKVIVGCVIGEYKTTAYRLLSDDIGIDLCSEVSYPVKCGISRIWVSQTHRKKGIGTSLLNCLRGNFVYGHILSKEDLAFSSPTDAGKAFAAKYFNTPNFLVYT